MRESSSEKERGEECRGQSVMRCSPSRDQRAVRIATISAVPPRSRPSLRGKAESAVAVNSAAATNQEAADMERKLLEELNGVFIVIVLREESSAVPLQRLQLWTLLRFRPSQQRVFARRWAFPVRVSPGLLRN